MMFKIDQNMRRGAFEDDKRANPYGWLGAVDLAIEQVKSQQEAKARELLPEDFDRWVMGNRAYLGRLRILRAELLGMTHGHRAFQVYSELMAIPTDRLTPEQEDALENFEDAMRDFLAATTTEEKG